MRRSSIIGGNTMPPSREQRAVYAFREDYRKRNRNIFTGAAKCLAPGIIVLWCRRVDLENKDQGQPWYDILVSLDDVAVDSHHVQLPPEESMLTQLRFAYIHLGFHDNRPRYNKVREALQEIVTGQPGKTFGWFDPIETIPDYDFSDWEEPGVAVVKAVPVQDFSVKGFMEFLREHQTQIGFVPRQALRISSLFRRGKISYKFASRILPKQLAHPLDVYRTTQIVVEGVP